MKSATDQMSSGITEETGKNITSRGVSSSTSSESFGAIIHHHHQDPPPPAPSLSHSSENSRTLSFGTDIRENRSRQEDGNYSFSSQEGRERVSNNQFKDMKSDHYRRSKDDISAGGSRLDSTKIRDLQHQTLPRRGLHQNYDRRNLTQQDFRDNDSVFNRDNKNSHIKNEINDYDTMEQSIENSILRPDFTHYLYSSDISSAASNNETLGNPIQTTSVRSYIPDNHDWTEHMTPGNFFRDHLLPASRKIDRSGSRALEPSDTEIVLPLLDKERESAV